MQSETFGLRRPPFLMRNFWTKMSGHQCNYSYILFFIICCVIAILNGISEREKIRYIYSNIYYIYIKTNETILLRLFRYFVPLQTNPQNML